MQSALPRRPGQAVLAVVLALVAIWARPAGALDLFARHEVTVQFATRDGKPMANAEVRVFAPGKPKQPALTGRTDKQGRFEFPADTDGFWSAEARADGEVARVMIRVGGKAEQPTRGLSPYWVFGGLFLLLVLAFAYRVMRARSRRPKR